MAKGKDRRPGRAFTPVDQGKKPRGGTLVPDLASKKFAWALDLIDFDGPFGWSKIDTRSLLSEVIPRLKVLENLTWGQMGTTGSHEIVVGDCDKSARDRLLEIKLEDFEALYSVRVTGRRRIFGIKDGSVLRIIWWDPEHQVCPSAKKNT